MDQNSNKDCPRPFEAFAKALDRAIDADIDYQEHEEEPDEDD